MDAALRSAHHDSRLLSTHLKRALGKGEGGLPESAARAATALCLAQGDTHGDLDAETALRLCRPTSPPPSSPKGGKNPAKGAALSAMEVENHGEAHAAAVNRGSEALPSNLAEVSAEKEGQLPRMTASGGCNAGNVFSSATDAPVALEEGRETGGCGKGNAGEKRLVDRSRLIAVLAAEERISAMANHLGSADPTMDSLSLLLLGRRPPNVPRPLDAIELFEEAQWQNEGMTSTMVHRESSAIGNGVNTLQKTAPEAGAAKSAGTLPRIRGESFQNNRASQRCARSAEDAQPSNTSTEAWDDAAVASPARITVDDGGGPVFANEFTHGRRKRSRAGEPADKRVEGRDVENAGHIPEGSGRSGLVRSGSYTTGQRQQTTAGTTNGMSSSSYCSLPKLKTSKLSW